MFRLDLDTVAPTGALKYRDHSARVVDRNCNFCTENASLPPVVCRRMQAGKRDFAPGYLTDSFKSSGMC